MKLLGTDEPGGYTPLEVCRAEVTALREERQMLLALNARLETERRMLAREIVTANRRIVELEAWRTAQALMRKTTR